MADLPVAFSQTDARRIDRAVRKVEGEPSPLTGETLLPGPRERPLRYQVAITGATRDGSNWRWAYTGRPQYRTGSGHGARSNAPRFDADITLHNSWEDAGTRAGVLPIATGTVVDAWYERYVDTGVDGVRWCFCVVNERPASFMVKVTKDGGAQGDSTTAATWTYTVKSEGGDTLASAAGPARARAIGITNFAPADSWGLAAYTAAGALVLLDVFGEYRGKVLPCAE